MRSNRNIPTSDNSLSNSPFQGDTPTVSSGTGVSPSSSLNHDNVSTYQEQVSNLGANKDIDFKVVNKHLVNQEDTLKLQGGDISRHIYHQMENSNKNGRRGTRSSSFSTYLTESRRESTASDINVPGGFRREFLIHKSLQNKQNPPNFLTNNFIEFLSIYGHFAGEDFSEDEGDTKSYEEVFDEESHLLARRQSPTPKEPPKGTASIGKTFFLLFKSLVGSGVLFLPRAFYNGGLAFSIVTLCLFGIVTYFCYYILIDSKKTLKLSSFGELGFRTHGKVLKMFISISIIMSQVGFVATYILFTAENMKSFLQNFLGWKSVNSLNIVIIQCVLLIPLVLIRNLTKLSLISLVSSVFIVIGLLIIFYYTGIQLLEDGFGPNITQFNSNSWTMLIGVAVTAFEGIGLILPIESSMAQPEKFPIVLLISMTIITLLFAAVGSIGYASYGDQVKSIIILNLPESSIAVQSIMVLYSIAVFLTAPLQLFPAIRIGESMVLGSFFGRKNERKDNQGRLYYNSGKYNSNVKWLKNFFRAISVVVICIIAYLNAKQIDKFVSFNGCFACIPLVYIYPPLIHLRTIKEKAEITKKDKILKTLDSLLVVVGICIVCYSSYQIIYLN